MDGFFSKASSFLNSQEPPPASSHEDKSEEKSHKAPSSGGYGDLLASAQSLMGSTKPHGAGGSDEKEGETHKAPSSGGYGDLLASAQSLMGSAKLSGGTGEGKLPVDDEGEGKPVDKKAAAHGDSGYGDVYASAQVLMGAARDRGAADMGEVAGAAANLIGAGTRYGNLEKGAYGEYAHKAQTYLHDYQTSHSKPSPQAAIHKPSSVAEGKDEEGSKAHETSEEGEPPRRKYTEDE